MQRGMSGIINKERRWNKNIQSVCLEGKNIKSMYLSTVIDTVRGKSSATGLTKEMSILWPKERLKRLLEWNMGIHSTVFLLLVSSRSILWTVEHTVDSVFSGKVQTEPSPWKRSSLVSRSVLYGREVRWSQSLPAYTGHCFPDASHLPNSVSHVKSNLLAPASSWPGLCCSWSPVSRES